ncbi:MAG: PIG-L family deacetylase [Acidobacteriia bacterium]|nr:PIG-L family deacetylase [Terriglobia bacterium]
MPATRRDFLGSGLAAFAAAPAFGEPLRVVCIGGHPDDPESGCGGTLARYAEAGHAVTVIYLTRGEAGIPGRSHDEAAAIRTAEGESACRILKAKPVFAGQIDGATVADNPAVQRMTQLVRTERPDILLAHWPLDTHKDHQVASLLAYRAWLAARPRFGLYFFEVDLGSQTMGFHPTDYVDITAVREKKKAALFAHRSQDGEGVYRQHHEIMENYRGREYGAAAAEAFVRLARSGGASAMPGNV